MNSLGFFRTHLVAAFGACAAKTRGLLLVGPLTAVLAAQTGFAADVTRWQVSNQGGQAVFKVWWDGKPDFTTADANDPSRQADSFQFFVNYDGDLGYGENMANPKCLIIRGEEIHFFPPAAQAIPIRSNSGDGGATAGGWGPIRQVGGVLCQVPFSVDGQKLEFSVPLDWIAVPADATSFSYCLEWYSYGTGRGRIFDEAGGPQAKSKQSKLQPDLGAAQASH